MKRQKIEVVVDIDVVTFQDSFEAAEKIADAVQRAALATAKQVGGNWSEVAVKATAGWHIQARSLEDR